MNKIGKKRKIIKKYFAFVLLFITLLNNQIFAQSLYNRKDEKVFGDYRIYSRVGNEKYIYYNDTIQTNFEYYYINSKGIEMPAYCLNLGVDGAEKKDEYYVNVSENIKDKKLVSIMLNGYPYKSVQELKVENVSEAKYATQFAVWAYLSNLSLGKIIPTSHTYQRVVNAIFDIYNNGLGSTYNENNMLNFQNSEFKVDNVDNSYFSSNIHMDYNDNIKDIKLQINNVDSYKITDSDNNELKNIYGIYDFKILVPRNKVLDNKILNINIEYSTRQTAIMFGSAKIPGMQNVSVNLEPILYENISKNIDIKYLPVEFEIIKLDKDNEKIKIPNVKFELYNEKEELLGKYVTDKDGKIKFDILKELNIQNGQIIKIKEVEVPDSYYIDKENDTQIIKIDYDKENKVIFENEKIKGKIKIIKSSKDFNEFNNYNEGALLKDAIFEIYDEKNNLVQEIITNEKGEAITKDLLKGKYYIKEKNAPKYYILDDNKYEVVISKHNEIVTVNLKNSSEKRVELPKTGY